MADKEALMVEQLHGSDRGCRGCPVVAVGAVIAIFILACGIIAVGTVTYSVHRMYVDLRERVDELEKGMEECRTRSYSISDEPIPPDPNIDGDDPDIPNETDEGDEESSDDSPERSLDIPSGQSYELSRRRRRAPEQSRSQRRHRRTTKSPSTKNPISRRKSELSAIHLNLNIRQLTSRENQSLQAGHSIDLDHGYLTPIGYKPKPTEQSDGRTYTYKAWKVADWVGPELPADYEFDQNSGAVKIKKRGLYFIYSQILYHNTAPRSSFVIKINNNTFAKCMESVDAVMGDNAADSARYKTCYTGAASVLEPNDVVSIHDLYSHHTTTDEHANFFGLIKFADLG